jgi:hypothetical protein
MLVSFTTRTRTEEASGLELGTQHHSYLVDEFTERGRLAGAQCRRLGHSGRVRGAVRHVKHPRVNPRVNLTTRWTRSGPPEDTSRRPSKRQKDLADIARILEQRPGLRARVPDSVRQRLI